jgi:hypothetical protein
MINLRPEEGNERPIPLILRKEGYPIPKPTRRLSEKDIEPVLRKD